MAQLPGFTSPQVNPSSSQLTRCTHGLLDSVCNAFRLLTAAVYHPSTYMAFSKRLVVVDDHSQLGIVTNVVSIVLSAIAFLTSACILFLIHLWKRSEKQKLRSQMLIGLFVSHLLTSLLLLVLITVAVAGKHPASGSAACLVMSMFIASLQWTEYLWTIALAVVTYCVLLHPLAGCTHFLKRHAMSCGALLYLVSAGLGVGQNLIHGAAYVGGFCFSHSPTSTVFDEATVFGPRCVTFVVIAVLYLRTYCFLRFRKAVCSATSPTTPAKKLPPASEVSFHEELDLRPPPPKRRSTIQRLISTIYPPATSHAQAPVQEPLLYLGDNTPPVEPSIILEGTGGISPERIDTPTAQSRTSDTASIISSTPSRSRSTPLSTRRLTTSTVSSGHRWDEWGFGDPMPAPPPSSFRPIRPASRADSSTTLPTIRISCSDDDRVVSIASPRSFHSGELPPSPTSLSSPHLPYINHTPRGSLASDATAWDLNAVPAVRKAPDSGHQETSARTLARNASHLFLLFPLSYLVITAVGVGRFIDALTSSSPNPWFHTVSRWSLLLQAPLDAVTLYAASRYVGNKLREKEGA